MKMSGRVHIREVVWGDLIKSCKTYIQGSQCISAIFSFGLLIRSNYCKKIRTEGV